jgi:hypothetical protein
MEIFTKQTQREELEEIREKEPTEEKRYQRNDERERERWIDR